MTTTHQDSPRARTRRTVRLGAEEIEIIRLAPTPTLDQVSIDDETECVTALAYAAESGLLPGNPPGSLGRALARAATEQIHLMPTRIRTGIVTDRTDTADVAVVRTTVSPMTVLPGEQPRGGSAGGRPTQVREPAEGHDPEASRLGLRVLVFTDTDHLRRWCADALARSLIRADKRGRPREVLATGVRRPVSASMTLLQFEDGTASQWVPLLSDGISRLAVCAAGLTGQLDGDPDAAADAIVHRLLPLSALTADSPTHELARKMRANHQRYVAEWARHVDEIDGPDEHGVRMQQFLTLPADLHLLAQDPATGEPHPMEPAMEAVVSDQHTGVDGWAHEDNSRHTALRALKRLLNDGVIDQDLFDLCSNRCGPGESVLLQSRPDGPEPSVPADPDSLLLRRAVVVMAALLGPSVYAPLKERLKTVSGRKRLTMHQVVDYVAPLVCEPWGALKPITRAWAYGGPVPPGLRDVQLRPVNPDDYLDLVHTATDPGSPEGTALAARLELALAGGTALIADGVLTTALVGGSGSAATPLPFRGPVSSAVEALTRTANGLTALAVAANHFKPRRSVRLSRLPGIDPDRPDKVARDGVGVPVRTTETVLAGYAARADLPGEDEASPDLPTREPTPLENLQARARHLPAGTRSMLRDIELTKALHDESGGPCGLSEHDLDTVHDSLSRALRLAGRLT